MKTYHCGNTNLETCKAIAQDYIQRVCDRPDEEFSDDEDELLEEELNKKD